MEYISKFFGGLFSPVTNAVKSVFEGINFAIGGLAIGTVVPFAATLLKDNVDAEWAQNISNGLLKHTGGVHMGGGEYRWGRWLDHAMHTGKWFGVAGTAYSFGKHTVEDTMAARANTSEENRNAATGAHLAGTAAAVAGVGYLLSEYGDDALEAVGWDDFWDNNIAPIGRGLVDDVREIGRDVSGG